MSRLHVPLDASFPDDGKIVEAGEKAAWLYVVMMCKAKQLDSDGILTRAQIGKLGVPGWQGRLKTLVSVVDDEGKHLIVESRPGSYFITAWLGWNKSRQQRDADRAADRKRKADKKAEESNG